MESEFGLPKELVIRLEAPIDTFTFDSVVERLDEVFSKGWSYHFHGPERIDVPRQVPKYPKSKNPTAFKNVETAHWQCQCSIEISTSQFSEIIREYSVLVPISEVSSYEQARDLSFMYTAHYGLGVGRRSKDLFVGQDIPSIELTIGSPTDVITEQLSELRTLLKTYGLSSIKAFDSLVTEWNPELKSHKDINRINLKEFVEFLQEKTKSIPK